MSRDLLKAPVLVKEERFRVGLVQDLILPPAPHGDRGRLMGRGGQIREDTLKEEAFECFWKKRRNRHGMGGGR